MMTSNKSSGPRVLHIYRTYFPETQGGGQEAIRQLCFATQDQGVSNTVFALAKRPAPTILHLPEATVVRARSWIEIGSCDFGASTAFRLCREAADQCDIIQIHFPWPFADLLLPFIRRRNQPLVVTYVSDVVRQVGLNRIYAPLRNYLLTSASKIIASSKNYSLSSPILRDYAEKLVVIPHCLQDVPDISKNRLDYWKRRLGQSFFLFVGVLRYYKGLHDLLAASKVTDAKIVIVGDGPEGDQLKKTAQEMKLHNVEFLGMLPDEDKNALMSLCRGVVFPSHMRSEAFGMTLLEGCRAGKPLICCDIGTGTTSINIDGETGLVVQPSDPVGLAQAINLLAQDNDLCDRLGRGARLRWKKHFTPEVVGFAYRSIYDELLRDEFASES